MKWTIHSKETPMECYLRLSAITDPANAPFLYTESHFCGTVGRDSFEIRFCDRPASLQMRLYPFKIKGRFLETANGTDIVLQFRPHLPRWLWWLLPSAFLIPLMVFSVFYKGTEKVGELGAFLIVFLLYLAFFILGTLPAALCALKILKSTFR